MIYLILSAGFKDNNPDQFEKRLKIGYTDNLENRLKAYQTTNPDFILLQTRDGDTTIESYLHKKFEKYRYKDSKEWFYYNQEIIDYFQDEVEDFIDEDILLECIKKDLRSKISSIPELKEKYLNQILDEIKSLDKFDEELYNEEEITRVILDVWELGINLFNKAIDNVELVNFQPIDLLKIDNPEITVDITLDLPQILGRQRLDCNPWKNRAELYVKFLSIGNKKTKEDFDKYINNKIKKTNELLNIYSGVSESSAKHTLVETYQYVAKSRVYSENYVAVNTHKGRDLFPVFNNLVMISEKRAFDIQQTDYADRFKVLSKVIIGGYEIDPITDFVNKFISYFKELPYFTDRMRYLCNNDFSDKKILNLVLSQIPIDYSTFYNTLGPERIKALGYQKSKLEKDLQDILNINSNFSDIQNKVLVEFHVGQKIPLAEIKQKLKDIYCEFNYNKTAKATDLIEFFEVSECLLTRVVDGEKKRVKGYEIISKKEKLTMIY